MTRHVPRYRFRKDTESGFAASLRDGPERLSVRLVDISSNGAAVLLHDPPASADALLRSWKREGRLTLVIEGEKVGPRLILPLIPVHAQDLKGNVLLGARFKVDEVQQVQLEHRIEKIFNRRGAVRATPKDRQRVPVVLQPVGADNLRLLGRLDDISLSGVGVTVDAFATAALTVGQRVRVALRLDDGQLPIDVECVVRHVRPVPGGTGGIAGLQFSERDARNATLSKGLCRWITQRTLEDRHTAHLQRRARGA